MILIPYTEITTALRELTDLKIVGKFNDQYNTEASELPFNYPACFVSFNFETRAEGKQSQQIFGTVTLHLGVNSSSEMYEDLNAIAQIDDLLKKIQYKMSNYVWTSLSSFIRRAVRESPTSSDVFVTEIDYDFTFKDLSGQKILESMARPAFVGILDKVDKLSR